MDDQNKTRLNRMNVCYPNMNNDIKSIEVDKL